MEILLLVLVGVFLVGFLVGVGVGYSMDDL